MSIVYAAAQQFRSIMVIRLVQTNRSTISLPSTGIADPLQCLAWLVASHCITYNGQQGQGTACWGGVSLARLLIFILAARTIFYHRPRSFGFVVDYCTSRTVFIQLIGWFGCCKLLPIHRYIIIDDNINNKCPSSVVSYRRLPTDDRTPPNPIHLSSIRPSIHPSIQHKSQKDGTCLVLYVRYCTNFNLCLRIEKNLEGWSWRRTLFLHYYYLFIIISRWREGGSRERGTDDKKASME
jgi:hypothetical protein